MIPDLVLIDRAAELTGYTVKAIQRKIDSGVWKNGEVWFVGPDGRRFVSMSGYQRWVEMGQGSRPARRASSSRSPTKASTTA